MRNKCIAILILPLIPISSSCLAVDLTFNGFGSLKGTYVQADSDVIRFQNFPEDGKTSFKAESLFALQSTADLGNKLKATVQFVAEGKEDFDVEARWAYLSYELSDNQTLSIGKFANPIFYQSEYEKVGYAHQFTRLPRSVYEDIDFSTIEGVKWAGNYNLNDYFIEAQILYGNWEGELLLASTGTNEPLGQENIINIRMSVNKDWWTLFAGFEFLKMDAEEVDQKLIFPFAQGGIDQAIAQDAISSEDVAAFQEAIRWDGKDGEYVYAGFQVDYNDWLFDGEFTRWYIADSIDAINAGWYLAAGKRFNNITVTAHYEKFYQETDKDWSDGITNAILLATGNGIETAFGRSEYDGFGVDVRYDFHPSAALKIGFLQAEDKRAEFGDFTTVTAGVDFIF